MGQVHATLGSARISWQGRQGAYWSPDTRSTKGYAGKWFMYFQTVAGFALGLLAVAGFSGIVKSN